MRRPARACSGIILAGGRSARFGRDKLAEPIDGRPLLDHAVDAVAAVAVDVVLVLAPGASSRRTGARFIAVHDPESYGGPLVGILAGLEAAREPIAIVVGGDMPGLQPGVLTLLVDRLAASDSADAVVLDDGGRARPLPMAVRVGGAKVAATEALTDGARALHALLDRLRVEVISLAEWQPLDPAGETLRDIDHPNDLGSTNVLRASERPARS